MKKYYIHNGTEQIGPLTKEELITQGITVDTPVWYEGITDWTIAGKIEELNGSLKPPPFKSNATPPPPPPKVTTQPIKKEKKSSSLYIILGLVAVVLIGYLWMNSVNNGSPLPDMKIQINRPKPAVLASRADKSKSDIKMRVTVYGTIQNQGGLGNIIVTFTVIQDGNSFDRTKVISLSGGEAQEVDATFDEVTRLGGEMQYKVSARAE